MTDPLILSPLGAMVSREQAAEREVAEARELALLRKLRAQHGQNFEEVLRVAGRKPLRKADKDRKANDAYYTDPALALAICEWLNKRLPSPARVLEPCVGGGAFLRAIRTVWPNATTGIEDIDAAAMALLRAERRGSPGSTGADYSLSVSNPPFRIADRLVRTNMERVPSGGHVAFLLPVGFIATDDREALYAQCPLRYYVPISPRPSFQENGQTAPTEYALYVFERNYSSNAQIVRPGIRWKKPGRAP